MSEHEGPECHPNEDSLIGPDHATSSWPPNVRDGSMSTDHILVIGSHGKFSISRKTGEVMTPLEEMIPSIVKTGTYTMPAEKKVEVVEDIRRVVASLLKEEGRLMAEHADLEDLAATAKNEMLAVRAQRLAIMRSNRAAA
jgi:hypothetical protein